MVKLYLKPVDEYYSIMRSKMFSFFPPQGSAALLTLVAIAPGIITRKYCEPVASREEGIVLSTSFGNGYYSWDRQSDYEKEVQFNLIVIISKIKVKVFTQTNNRNLLLTESLELYTKVVERCSFRVSII
jgi:hypothetical protein